MIRGDDQFALLCKLCHKRISVGSDETLFGSDVRTFQATHKLGKKLSYKHYWGEECGLCARTSTGHGQLTAYEVLELDPLEKLARGNLQT